MAARVRAPLSGSSRLMFSRTGGLNHWIRANFHSDTSGASSPAEPVLLPKSFGKQYNVRRGLCLSAAPRAGKWNFAGSDFSPLAANHECKIETHIGQWTCNEKLLAKLVGTHFSTRCRVSGSCSSTDIGGRRYLTSRGEHHPEPIQPDSLSEQTAESAPQNKSRKSLAVEKLEGNLFLQEEVRKAAEGEETESELERAMRNILEALRKEKPEDQDSIWESMFEPNPLGDLTLGKLYLVLGQKYKDKDYGADAEGYMAEQILRCGQKALEIFQTKMEDVRLEMGIALTLIAVGYSKQEKYEASLPVLHQALNLLESEGGEESRVAKCNVRSLLGEALDRMRVPDDALVHLRLAVTEEELLYGQDHVQLAKSYRKLAEVMANASTQLEEALRFAEKALQIHKKAFGDGSMDEAIDRKVLAKVYTRQDEHEKALEEHIMVRRILSSSAQNRVTAFDNLFMATTETHLGKYSNAISSVRTALAKVEKGSAMHALAFMNLAKVYECQNKPQEADEQVREVLKILESKAVANMDPWNTIVGFNALFGYFSRLNKKEAAVQMLKRAHAIHALIPNQRNAVAKTEGHIGICLLLIGKVEEAVFFLESAAKDQEGTVGEQRFDFGIVLNSLGMANLELERLESAREHFERAKTILDELEGPDPCATLEVARNLVYTYVLLDRLDDAIKYQEEIIWKLRCKGDAAKDALKASLRPLEIFYDHRESGKSIRETLASVPLKFK